MGQYRLRPPHLEKSLASFDLPSLAVSEKNTRAKLLKIAVDQ